MNHQNVLRIEGVAPDLFECCMVSRWMENGNMSEYLNHYPGHINRLELVSSNSDRVGTLLNVTSSYLASSVVWTTYILIELFTVT